MNHGSLFSGIGGFDLAAQWMGWTNVFHCEFNPFGQRVLKHYWPNAISYGDIKQTDFTIHRGQIDVLSGGFPCQPFSTAGKRKGTEDDRYLWPEMLRAIREIQPRYVVGENVRGLTNWNGGLVFDQVLLELEAEGYEVIPFLLPAAGLNAPHKRDRIWIVAHAKSHGGRGGLRQVEGQDGGKREPQERRQDHPQLGDHGAERATPDTESMGWGRGRSEAGSGGRQDYLRQGLGHTQGLGEGRPATDPDMSGRRQGDQAHAGGPAEQPHSGGLQRTDTNPSEQGLQGSELHGSTGGPWPAQGGGGLPLGPVRSAWQDFPSQPPVRGGDDGLPSGLAGITLSRHRRESLKGYGNAIVPQIAFEIFKSIIHTNNKP